jgi:regulatory protein YycI of two-component signal transduction system YycFG
VRSFTRRAACYIIQRRIFMFITVYVQTKHIFIIEFILISYLNLIQNMNKKCGHAKQLVLNHFENSGLNQNTQIVHTSFVIESP